MRQSTEDFLTEDAPKEAILAAVNREPADFRIASLDRSLCDASETLGVARFELS